MSRTHGNGALYQRMTNVSLSRRDLLKRFGIVGVTAISVPALLSACETDDEAVADDEDVADAPDDDIDDEDVADAPDDDIDDEDVADAPDDVTDDEDLADDEVADEPDDVGDGPVRGGELVARGGGVTHLDPQLAEHATVSMMFNLLLRYSPEGQEPDSWELRPELVESWEFDDDAMSLVMELRQDVTFHDGSPWNAETAEWNLLRIRDHDLSFQRSVIAHIADFEVEDEYTIRCLFDEPSAMPSLLPIAASTWMVSMVAVEELGDEGFGQAPVGSGPCRFVEWFPDGHIDLERNPDYWEIAEDGEPYPYFDTYRERFIADLEDVMTELRAGTIVAYNHPPAANIPTLEDDPNTEVFIVPNQYRHDLARIMINGESEPFSDSRVRHAALHALDQEGFANAMGPGVLEPHYTLWWVEGVIGYDPDIRSPEYDPERAQELLTEAGFPDGIDVVLTIQNRTTDRQAGQILQQMWEAVGIRTTIETFERVAYNANLAERDYEVSVIGTGTEPDPELAAENMMTDGARNWGKYSNPRVDELFVEARRLDDEDERAELYKEIQRLIHEDGELSILSRHPRPIAKLTRLRGLTTTAHVPQLRYAWLEEE